jgi:hypothetical protein
MRWLALLAAILISVGGTARAQSPQAPLSLAMQTHFEGERDEGYAWMGFGAATLVTGGILYKEGGDLQRGIAYPALSFGSLHMLIGMWLLGVSDRRVAGLRAELDRTPEVVRARELKRIQGIARSLFALRIGEAVITTGAVGLAIGGGVVDDKLLLGIGLSVAVETIITFVLDTLAAHRAKHYIEVLSSYHF